MILLLSALTVYCAVAAVADAPADRCLMLDSCYFKTAASKTCSCQPDCHLYGTCCLGAEQGADTPQFRCYGGRVRTPLFVVRSCKPGYRGHPHEGATCTDDDVDEADVVGNRLVTDRKSKVTYWNKQCAKCNGLEPSQMDFWDIAVQCVDQKFLNRWFVRKHLAYHRATRRWGMDFGNEQFLPCNVHYVPPAYLDEVKHCTPDVIGTCPPGYPDQERARKCSQSYAERKLRGGEVYFRNVHCALCNGFDETEVECTGMAAENPDEEIDDSDFREMKEEVFKGGEWLSREPGREFECSPGYLHDPFRGKCRTYETEGGGDAAPFDSAPANRGTRFLMLVTLPAALLLLL